MNFIFLCNCQFVTCLPSFQVLPDADDLQMEDDEKVGIKERNLVSSAVTKDDKNDQSEESDAPVQGKVSRTKSKVKTNIISRTVPPPGTGQKIYKIDPTLADHRPHLDYR